MLKLAARYISLGWELVLCIFIGYGIGWLVDRWLNTKPWFSISFLLLGIGAGFKALYKASKKM
jgi:ATP synthase protein I